MNTIELHEEILIRYDDGEPVIENMLAILLINEVIVLNNYWWKPYWSDEAKNSPSLGVICNDTFYYASADAEEINHNEIPELFEFWEKDKELGPLVWCCKKRKMKPLKEVYSWIQGSGKWDLDKIINDEV